jgi:hypothetical protein
MRKAVDERAGFAAAYREGSGLAPVAVVDDGRALRIIASGDESALSALEKTQACWWCRRADDAARIAASAQRALRRESNDADKCAAVARAAAAVTAAAKKLNVALYSDGDVANEAMKVAARVDAELRELQRSGGLKSINRQYRSRRLETSARGERVLRYDEWMRQYRVDLVRQIAATLRQI